MKNFIFISPNFPETYWKFCAELKNNGLRVLGIGDCPYDELKQELRDSLHEYYRVSNLENFDEVFRAVAFFTYTYGKIDYLESNNEYWLERDAILRTEFHITSGFMAEDIEKVKFKSKMKEYYAKAGISTARYHLVEGYDDCKSFADMVGYPVIVKPDNGVGASNTFRIHNDQELRDFIDKKDPTLYIMEEYVKGYVRTYDAIIDGNGKPILESGNVTINSLMDVVNDCGESCYYIVKELPEEMKIIGRKTVEAFGVKSRFVHLEYFVLTEDQPVGKKDDIIGLEVNMRPAGGYTPDMYDYAYDTDVYKIWADIIAFNKTDLVPSYAHYCAFIGRRDSKSYKTDDKAIWEKYGDRLKMWGPMPKALSGAMGDYMYVANLDTKEDLEMYYSDLMA